METRQIAAIVLIVIVVAGVGVGIWWFLPQAPEPPYGELVIGQVVTPGAPAGVSDDYIIKVGILGPMTAIQGEGHWRGAYMACDELNTAGGVTIDSETYYFGIVAEDTNEASASFDPSQGVAAAQRVLTDDGAQFTLGGFRTESVDTYLGTVMAAKKLFLSCGAATDLFTEYVNDTYDTYKYFFKVTPINSTSLGGEIIGFLAALKPIMQGYLGKNVSKVAIIREDLAWTIPLTNAINYYLPFFGYNKTIEIAYPLTQGTSTDFATYWSQIEATGAQITIPVISGEGGISMTTQYAALQPGCLIAGIDVQAQLANYWNETGGACEHEVLIQTMHRTNKTTRSIDMWDSFLDHFDGDEPLYTAVGAYDAMYLLHKGINDAQSLNSTTIIPYLEAITTANPFEGVGANFAYTSTHDVFEGYIGNTIYSVGLFVQWQAGGAKEVVTTGGAVYPNWLATAGITFPSWGINDE
ncbi:MAG: ABC transporter substrate-binding protein [Candidatus Thorarchaeota archaeon]|nr:MAG: ABC transporter substrate-binding protein [Candidatus Thorarchaeota archaeon]